VPCSTITYLSLPEVARLIGCAPATAWRRARAGEFGQPFYKTDDSTTARYSVARIEAAYGAFTEQQVALAVSTRTKLPQRKTRVACIVERELALRDGDWRTWLSSKKHRQVYPDGPPPHPYRAQVGRPRKARIETKARHVETQTGEIISTIERNA